MTLSPGRNLAGIAVWVALITAASLPPVASAKKKSSKQAKTQSIRYDEFTYRETDESERVYGPPDWDEVNCGPGNNHHDTCPGWPDDWETYRQFLPYKGEKNQCNHCTESNNSRECNDHNQSPIDLLRSFKEKHYDGGEEWLNCRDKHRMFPARGTCTWEHLTNNPDMPEDQRNGFTIEPHALRIQYPIKKSGKLMCPEHNNPDRPHRQYDSVDWSGNFAKRWQLVHIDLVTPSLHTMGDIRYDAEVIMAHMWPINNLKRQMGKMSFWLQGTDMESGKSYEEWNFLNKLIEEWQSVEQKVNDKCDGTTPPPAPPADEKCGGNRRRACRRCYKQQKNISFCRKLLEDYTREQIGANCCDSRRMLDSDAENSFEAPVNATTWTRELDVDVPIGLSTDATGLEGRTGSDRKYRNVKWYSYAFWNEVNTHYYLRYEGSQHVPPCLEEVDWRIYHQPIRVAKSQIEELQRLIAQRRNPKTCEYDTVGKVTRTDTDGVTPLAVETVRPIMKTTKQHELLFCMCEDWRSNVEADREWCANTTLEQRLGKGLKDGDAPDKYLYNYNPRIE